MMGRFNRLLDATYTPPSRWVLNTALSYDTDVLTESQVKEFKRLGVRITIKGKITAPKGFDTDLASVPRAGWMFIAPFDVARAAVIHDVLYKAIREGDSEMKSELRKAADLVFKDAMAQSEPVVAPWKCWSAWAAVRAFGWNAVKVKD